MASKPALERYQPDKDSSEEEEDTEHSLVDHCAEERRTAREILRRTSNEKLTEASVREQIWLVTPHPQSPSQQIWLERGNLATVT